MLIFDHFPDSKHADDFAIHVRDTFGRATRVCDSQEKSDRYDPVPFVLQPPIVLIERDAADGPQLESQIIKSVERFSGIFSGT